jgi:hypothetical protein
VTAKLGWARPAGKAHIFAVDADVSVCRATGRGQMHKLTNAPKGDRICPKCLAWLKAKKAGEA